jgi:zinc protease
VHADEVFALVEKYFAQIPGASEPHRPAPAPTALTDDIVLQLEDDVHLPRLYMTWHSPRILEPGDAELDIVARVLGSGKTARLYQRLVHELEIAQDVDVEQESGLLGSSFAVSVTAREGVTLPRIRDEVRQVLAETVAGMEPREIMRARHHIETATIDSIQNVGGFGGKADRLNHYFFYTGDAGYLGADLARYTGVEADSARDWLRRIVSAPSTTLSVIPRGRADLAVSS